jgi:hypothetical protein
MNRIVRTQYPVAKLPNDLRQGLDPEDRVTVTVEIEAKPNRRVLSLEEILAARKPPFRTAEEIDAEIREGRDDAEA